MVPHFRPNAGAGVSREDDVRCLVGQVAVDALAGEGATATREEAAAFHFVTCEAASGKISDVALW